MKKLFAAALVLALFSCRGGENGQGTGNQTENESDKGIALQLERIYTQSPFKMSATIYPDSIVVVKDSICSTYIIDKEKSYETVEIQKYIWNFIVSGKGETSLPCDTIVVDKYRTEIFGEKRQWDMDRFILKTKEGHYFQIQNEFDLQRRMFANYPESKPFPELLMENAKFYNIYRKDSSEIPSFLWPVNRVVIKDNKITFSGGENDVVLEMVPLSDYEQVYSEGYNWVFTTKATDKYPAIRVTLNAGFDFEKKELKPKERWISLFLDDIGEIQFEFQSWDNLKRRICVTYPTEEEFQSTMEEGILPDLSE